MGRGVRHRASRMGSWVAGVEGGVVAGGWLRQALSGQHPVVRFPSNSFHLSLSWGQALHLTLVLSRREPMVSPVDR